MSTSHSNATSRIQDLEKEHRRKQEDIKRQRVAIAAATVSVVKNATATNTFSANAGTVDDLLTTDTVGLVTHHDFKARRQYLEQCATHEIEKRRATIGHHSDHQQPRLKRKRTNKALLSFQTNSDEEEEDDDSSDDGNKSAHKERDEACDNQPAEQRQVKHQTISRKRLGKDPLVEAMFLPDRDLEVAETAERERLKHDWLRQQELIKNEIIQVTYSYWDGSGHRRVLSCKKGTTIERFLAIVQTKFKQLRNTSPESLMFVKEDLIIPQHYSFYDFVVMKARGKSGPLFNFDVVQDIRLVADANEEKEDAHAAKVVERRWYERNRHIFPASRWELYDPTKKYARYTIHG